MVVTAGCYSYLPLTTPDPQPGTPVALELNDAGRVGVAESIGPGILRVQGSVVRATETAYVVSIADVLGLDRRTTKWAGETVGIQRSFVAMPYERRFSKGRTIAVIGVVLGGVTAFVLTWNLLGFGGPLSFGGGGDGGQNQ